VSWVEVEVEVEVDGMAADGRHLTCQQAQSGSCVKESLAQAVVL
jgi:hypothetical protein